MTRNFRCRTSFLLLLAALLNLFSIPAPVSAQEQQDKQIDRQHMRQIYDALMAFKKDKGQLPDWLSDLYPKYLTDPDILMSPVEKATGTSRLFGYDDPKMKTSYIYEFGGAKSNRKNADGKTMTMREWKAIQMESFGEVIPILRCHLHDPVLNMSFSGELFETVLFWETDPHTLALMKKLGTGKVSKPESIIHLQALTMDGSALEGVEISSEKYETTMGPLAPRSVVTDAQGKAEFPIGPGKLVNLALSTAKSGYSKAAASWEQDTVPQEYAFKLVKAIMAGGVIQEQAGGKIAGATVVINGIARDAVGQSIEVLYDTTLSDEQGRWQTDKIPADFTTLSIRVQHTNYFTGEFEQGDENAQNDKSFTRETVLAKTAVFSLEPGILVTGRVTDESGQALPEAKVLMAANEALKDKASIAVDAKGNFKIMRLETGFLHLIATGKKLAPQYRKIDVQRELKSVNFELKKGRNLKFKVTDSTGKTLSGARVAVESWNGLKLLSWSDITDENGECNWDSAPSDKVTLTAAKPEYDSHTQTMDSDGDLKAMFPLQKLFKISGKALDADTKQPIARFKVYRGYVYDGMNDDRTRWENYNVVEGKNGVYSVPPGQSSGWTTFKYMAVADGYLPSETPLYHSQEPQTFNFEMKNGNGPRGQVLLPNGEPAVNAEAAIVGWVNLTLSKGAIISNSSDRETMNHTDKQGRFSLPAVLASPGLIFVHKEGFAEIAGADMSKSNIVILKPWASIKGTYKYGTKPASNVTVKVVHDKDDISGVIYDFEESRSETDENGTFSFNQVPPGRRALVRLIQSSPRSWMWSHIREIDLQPGQTLEMTYGGEGQPVIGKLMPPGALKAIDWQNSRGRCSTKFVRTPGPSLAAEEQKAYYKSAEYKEELKRRKNFSFKVQDDGSFYIDNVPAGVYTLTVDVREPGEGNNYWNAPIIGRLNKEITVPEAPGGCTDAPLDLGELKLESAK